ncbi:MAG: DUF3450 domain-containing protein [Marinobacterium sp.]|nr:DUF3450 domain-containing protein [Marinobacterium sp.]
MVRKVTGSFDLTDPGKSYGNHRNYDLAKTTAVINAPATQELIRNREAVGYFGHNRRTLGKLQPGESDLVATRTGPIIVENVPACITTGLTIDGTKVSYEVEVLDTEPGKVIQSMIDSKVGGFSWAMPGQDGRRIGISRPDSYLGMDYVVSPGFNSSRPYALITESAEGDTPLYEGQEHEALILESATRLGVPEERARAYLNSINSPVVEAVALSAENESLITENAELTESLSSQSAELADLKQQLSASEEASKVRLEKTQAWVADFPFHVPEAITESIAEGDIRAGLEFMHNCIMESAKLNTLPVGTGSDQRPLVTHVRKVEHDPRYPSAHTAPEWNQ